MPTVKISTKYQVVIPREVREITEIRPGTMVDVQVRNGEIVLVPVRPMKEMRAFLKGLDTTIERELDRRL